MATFTWTPSVGASVALRPNVRRVAFGDGYEQRLAFGLNTKPEVWTLEFRGRTSLDAAAIEHHRGEAEQYAELAILQPDIAVLVGGADGHFAAGEYVYFELRDSDFSGASLVAEAVELDRNITEGQERLKEIKAQLALEAITGRYTADDLLGLIFSTFCLGK